MNINLNYASRTPIYEQIVNEIERLVTLEIIKKGEQIPSIRELACFLGINPNTVKKAYDLLEQKGIIISKSTKGTFISDDITEAKKQKVEKLMREIKDCVNELESYGISKEEILKKLK